jgi:predicted Rossmann fold nucleotide-binding protein DprA/Smf involved in DNA uptake
VANVTGDQDHSTVESKRPVEILRDRHGGVSAELRERTRRHRRLRKAIRQALADAERTVPELAGETGWPAHEVLWMLMALRKYGEVRETGEQDSYPVYGLHEPETSP